MKRQIKNLMLVAVAAMGFTACQENIEEATRPIEPAEVEMTITANMDDTRTWIDEANSKVQWSEDDQLKVIENSANYRTTKSTTIENGKAKFTVAFAADETSTEFTYNAVYPATAVNEDDTDNINNAKIKVIVKSAQNPTATSFDPAADILISKQITTDAQPTELNMQFKRLVAMGKLTLKGLPESSTISQVAFTAGAEDILAGRNYVDGTTGTVTEYGYYGETNAITLSYPTPITTRDIYFCSNPFAMEAGETFTVKVICNDATYTRSVTIPAGRALNFTEGNLSTLTVDMSSATKEENFVFPDGEYAIIAVKGTTYYAMTNVDNGAGTKRFNTTEVTYDGSATTFTTTDTSLKWTIKAVEGGYTISDVDGKYLSWTSGNSAYAGDNSFLLNIAQVDGTNQYNISVSSDSERKLAKNSSNPYFAFYGDTQEKNLYLVPVAISSSPRFSVTPESQNISYEGGSVEFEVVAINGFNAAVTATTNAEWLTIENNGNIYTATAQQNNDEAREATIKFSADGYDNINVTVKQGANSNIIKSITISEFIEKADEETNYQISGTITNVVNTSYGNFHLTDETGSLYIFGLLTPDGTEQKQWNDAGLKEGDAITIYGKYKLYNTTHEMIDATYVSHYGISVDTEQVEFTVEGGTATINVALTNTEEEYTVIPSNDYFTITPSGNIITIVANDNSNGEVRSTDVKVVAGDAYTTFTISQAAPIADGDPIWTIVTDVTELAAGDQIVIVAKDENVALSTTQKTNNRAATSITKVSNIVNISAETQIITLETGTTTGTFAFNVGNGYLYAASSSKNHLKTETSLSANSSWSITIDTTGIATIKATGSNTRNWMRYNPNNGTPIFSCYSSGQQDVCIYKQN